MIKSLISCLIDYQFLSLVIFYQIQASPFYYLLQNYLNLFVINKMNHKYQNSKDRNMRSPAYKPKLINHLLDSSEDESDEDYQEVNQQYFQNSNKRHVHFHDNRENDKMPINQMINTYERSKSPFNSKPSSNGSQIHYQTLKLSEYESQQPVQTHKLTLNQYKRVDNDQKIKSVFEIDSKSRFCNDSLEQVKSANRSRIKQQQNKQQKFISKKQDEFYQSHIQLYERQISQFQIEIQSLKSQLKRSNDIIKTTNLKNTDLQKTIQMKNIQIYQLNSVSNRQKQFSSKNNLYQNKVKESIHQTYSNVANYMKQKIRQFVVDIKNIKMNPVLQQTLQNFLAQISQINEISVSKVLGLQAQNQKKVQQYKFYENNKQFQTTTPNKSCLKIYQKIPQHLNTPINLCRSQILAKNNANKNLLSRAEVQVKTMNSRQNALMRNRGQNQKSHVSNKTTEQFKNLQKSLQKLRQMQKQNTPNNNQSNLKNHFTSSKSQFQRSQYSIVGLDRSQISNIDKSRSKRKKIFN